MSGYTQLTQEERYQIHILKRAGHNQSEIAEMLGRHKATISRELKRNTGLSGYRPQQVCQKCAIPFRRHMIARKADCNSLFLLVPGARYPSYTRSESG